MEALKARRQAVFERKREAERRRVASSRSRSYSATWEPGKLPQALNEVPDTRPRSSSGSATTALRPDPSSKLARELSATQRGAVQGAAAVANERGGWGAGADGASWGGLDGSAASMGPLRDEPQARWAGAGQGGGQKNPRGGQGGPHRSRLPKLPRSTMFSEDDEPSPDLGLEPKVANLRRDVLALLADGHRLEQSQARQVTDMLRKGLEAKGRVQKLEIKRRDVEDVASLGELWSGDSDIEGFGVKRDALTSNAARDDVS